MLFASKVCSVQGVDQKVEEEEIRARAFLDELNDELNERRCKQLTAEWNFNVNITKENEETKTAISAENAEFYKVCLFFFTFLPLFKQPSL